MKTAPPFILLLSVATVTAQQPASDTTALPHGPQINEMRAVGDYKVPLQTWPELAAQAGLVGIGPKTLKEFKVDVSYEFPAYVNLAKAQISLTGEEWGRLISKTTSSLLDFHTHGVDEDTWKSVVDIIYPHETDVDTRKLHLNDPAVVLRAEHPVGSARVYILHADKDGSHKELFYFFNAISPAEPKEAGPVLQTWPELAAHAGLVSVGSKTMKEFKLDVMQSSPGHASLVRAEVSLTDAEYDYFIHNDSHHFLRFAPKTVDPATRKIVVDAVWPFETKVKTDMLHLDDTAAILRSEYPWSARVYFLHADKDGGHKKLFYFFNAIAPAEAGRTRLRNPSQK